MSEINNKTLVSICCPAFNHEKFIRQCIDSILMQKVNFKYEIILHDDASTDNTTNIIREYENLYPDIIKPIYQTKNQHSLGIINATIILPKANSKYIALCEGDDYWTDPLKLQKQVDFLEANPTYSACFHRSLEINEQLSIEKIIPAQQLPATITLDNLLEGINLIPTQSCVFKKLDTLLPDWFKQLPFGDYGLHLLNAKKGKIGFIDEVMGVYRISTASTHGQLSNTKKGLVKSSALHVKFWEVIEASNEFPSTNIKQVLAKAKLNHEYHQDVYLNSLNIMFISTNHWSPWGGSEVLWSEVAKFFKLRNPKAAILASIKEWQPIPKQIQALIKTGIEIVYYADDKLTRSQRMANRLLPDAYRIKFKTAIQKLHEYTPDLVVFSLGDHNEAGPLIASYRNKNKPYVLIIQLVKEGHIREDNYLPLLRENYQAAVKVYFVSKQNQEIVETQFATKLTNAEVISNPFPRAIAAQLPAFPSQKKIYSLAFVASLSANHKGHDLLFEVLSQPKWQQRNLEINLYGHGPHDKYLRELKDFYNLKSVNFIGFSNYLNDIWSKNQAIILCSRYEGQSLAMLEAMSYNRMAIVTDMGDARELITDGVNGFIAEAPTVKHIDEALERAWARRDDWEQMGKLAAERLLSSKSDNPIQTLVNKILNVTISLDL